MNTEGYDRFNYKKAEQLRELLSDCRAMGLEVKITIREDESGSLTVNRGKYRSFTDLDDLVTTLAVEISRQVNHRSLMERILGHK